MITKQGNIIGRNIANQAVPLILVEDYLSLNELLHSSMSDETKVEFLFILRDGKPFASTFKDGVPKGLIREYESKAENISYNFKIGNVPYLFFQKPLLKGELGYLCYGINVDEFYRFTNRNFYIILLFLFIVLGATMGGAYLVGRLIGKPLNNLVLYAEKVPNNEIEIIPVKMFYTFETKTLFKAFIKMVKRIKEADKEKEEFNQKMLASERLAAIGTLASGVAHEINNPLNGIEACLKRIKKLKNNPEKIEEYAESCQKSLNHMKNVTHQLLDFSKPKKYSFTNVNINEVIEKAVELAYFRFEKDNIELIKKFEVNVYPVKGDEHYLKQMFVNLILNSIDAMYGGGKLTITTKNDNGMVIVGVNDTGIGISSDVVNKIFDPFFTTKEQGKGTGLGLSVSYRIAQDHKGKLLVKSEKGIGTEFIFSVPVMG